MPVKVRLAELLKHLRRKGEEACHEFYRALHIHSEEIYSSLPSRVRQRGKNPELLLAADSQSDVRPFFYTG